MINVIARVIAPVLLFCHCRIECKGRRIRRAVKYWEIIADNLSKAGWSWGCVSAIDSEGRTIWIADAHRGGKRFVLRADELLTSFVDSNQRFDSLTHAAADRHYREFSDGMVRLTPQCRVTLNRHA